MSYRKALFVLSFIGLVFWTIQDASAQWGTGGSIKGTRKLDPTRDLLCDLSHPRSTAVIVTTPKAGDPPATRPNFEFSGQVVCAEVPTGTPNATLGNAVDLDGDNVPDIGLFNLIQVPPKVVPFDDGTFPPEPLRPGLQYDQPPPVGGVTTRTWTFFVDDPQTFPFAELLYELEPVADPAFNSAAFCPHPSDISNCKALFGLQLPANQADYPARDLDGIAGNDLELGQVFKFSTIESSNTEKAGRLFWGVCSSQAFIEPLDFDVFAATHSSNNGAGAGRDTGIDLGGGLFAVTVNQNDLWNAGALPRWSNADGLIQILFATGTDDSGQANGTQIGIDWPTDHMEGPSAVDPALTENFGTLVGGVGTKRFALGTSFNGTPPATGRLKLFYWDVNEGDNTEKVTVRVADKSIQCLTPGGEPAVAIGNARGNLEVEVVYNPTLNVDNKSKTANYPTTIVGCADYEPSFVIQSNGSPIINGTAANTQVLVNGTPVTLTGFHVANTISRPSCDDGQALPDLKLDLNRLSLINAVAPGGQCTNGLNSFKLEIGSDTNGWFGGTSTMTLSHCD